MCYGPVGGLTARFFEVPNGKKVKLLLDPQASAVERPGSGEDKCILPTLALFTGDAASCVPLWNGCVSTPNIVYGWGVFVCQTVLATI